MTVLFCLAAPSSPTPSQRTAFLRVQAAAPKRARDAEERLLDRLDKPDVRETLASCCSSVANLSSLQLLTRLRTEARVCEVVSSFNAFSPNGHGRGTTWFGPSMLESRNATHLENLWEVWVKEGTNVSVPAFRDYIPRLDDLEIHDYGFKPFSHRGQPASLAEARERAVYSLVNLLRHDAGSPLFGEVSLVLDHETVAASALVAPFDTGSWISMCNFTGPPSQTGFDYPHNCSAYVGTAGLGTLSHFEHLLMQNEAWWLPNSTAFVHKVARLLAPVESPPPLVGMDLAQYFEAAPATTLHYPQSVKFVIGDFSTLFGHPMGVVLRSWCESMGWVLTWTIGLNKGRLDGVIFWELTKLNLNHTFGTEPFARFVDPMVAQMTSANASFSTADRHALELSWEDAAAYRRGLANASEHNSTEWALRWETLRAATTPQLWVTSLHATACADVARCIGVARSGDCICYNRNTPTQLA